MQLVLSLIPLFCVICVRISPGIMERTSQITTSWLAVSKV